MSLPFSVLLPQILLWIKTAWIVWDWVLYDLYEDFWTNSLFRYVFNCFYKFRHLVIIEGFVNWIFTRRNPVNLLIIIITFVCFYEGWTYGRILRAHFLLSFLFQILHMFICSLFLLFVASEKIECFAICFWVILVSKFFLHKCNHFFCLYSRSTEFESKLCDKETESIRKVTTFKNLKKNHFVFFSKILEKLKRTVFKWGLRLKNSQLEMERAVWSICNIEKDICGYSFRNDEQKLEMSVQNVNLRKRMFKSEKRCASEKIERI